MLAEILEHKVVVIGRMDNFFDALSDSTFNSYHGPYFDDYVTSSVAKEPMSCLFVPIVDNATNLVPIVPSAESNDNRTIFGIMTVHVYWRDLLEGILPFHKTEVAIVVRNDCGQAYTYKVDSGNSPTYLGPGDLHDPAFDGTSVDLQIPGRYSSTARQYTGLPLGGEFCPYTLSVYPTQRRKNQFVTRLPIIMVATHAFIFVFTGVLFMLHRTFVERKRCGIFLYATHLYNCLDMFSLHARQGGEVDGTSVNAVNAAPAPPPPPPPAPMLATMLPPSAMTRVAGEDSNDNANIALASSQKQLEQVAAIATLVDAVPDYKDQCQLEPVGIRLLQQHPPAANVFHVADSDDDDEQAQA